jgi:uncharacterized protein (DUF924 family)
VSAAEVLRFWFEDCRPEQWFATDPDFDARLRQRFAPTHDAARRGELYAWRGSVDGRLAEVIVLDQFSRNLYRGTADAFACDTIALVLAQEAVASGGDRQLPARRRAFLYMPYMHSESLLIHEQATLLFSQPGLEQNLEYELRHKRILERFGRYPHRNTVLGRASSAEEIEFLQQPGSSF